MCFVRAGWRHATDDRENGPVVIKTVDGAAAERMLEQIRMARPPAWLLAPPGAALDLRSCVSLGGWLMAPLGRRRRRHGACY
jgi:hypothetical protein